MPKNGDVLRLGIIGCGRGTLAHHLPALSHIPQIKVSSVADTDSMRMNFVADRYGISQRYPDYRSMLCNSDIDAVAVVTPTQSHAEIGLAVLESGRHLFMEKPLALSLEESEHLMASASRTPCKVLVGLNNRWHRLVIRAKEIIRSGLLGNLKAIRSVYTHWHPGASAQAWHKSRALGGGVLFNDGVHHFDLWRFILDAEVAEIFAHSISSEHFEDETCTISARLDNGMAANAVFSFSTSANSELEIFGDKGRLILSLYRFDGLEFYSNTANPGSIMTRLQSAAHTLSEIPRALSGILRGGDFAASYDGLWRHFADCISHNTVPACTLEDGKRSLQVMLAALDACRSGFPIKIGSR